MNQFLRSLTPAQQVGALFLIVFGILLAVSIAAFLLTFRKQADAHDEAWHAELKNFRRLLRTTWFMVVVFWIGWVAGDTVATVLFALIAFFALREFITLSPTRRGDHRSLVLAFFIPVVSALAGDPQRFLERNAKLQWGIMVCIYGMSHVPALMLLDFRNYQGKGAFMVFFLVSVVQTCMLVQHVVTRRLKRSPSAPQVSKSFNWYSWLLGMTVGSFVGGLLSFITPFKPGQALAMAFVACVAGSMGHLVMKALKRDRGVTAWGQRGISVTGANGLLDRVDALCFAAPIFFHSARWYFGA
jgi:phosphatidate cytidylyltransferase